MPGTMTHLAIADSIYTMLGDTIIKNPPLFFGGNIAPDAIHAKKDYQRADKKRSHLCDGIRSYGYGYPEIAELFKNRINVFIKNYLMAATENRDLYLGYVVHLLTDEFYLLKAYNQLEDKYRSMGVNPDEPEFRKKLADEVNNGNHREFFSKYTYNNDILPNEYKFNYNVLDILNAIWDYEVKDHINANEINISKHWIISEYFKNKSVQTDISHDSTHAVQLVYSAAENIVACILDKDGNPKIL